VNEAYNLTFLQRQYVYDILQPRDKHVRITLLYDHPTSELLESGSYTITHNESFNTFISKIQRIDTNDKGAHMPRLGYSALG